MSRCSLGSVRYFPFPVSHPTTHGLTTDVEYANVPESTRLKPKSPWRNIWALGWLLYPYGRSHNLPKPKPTVLPEDQFGCIDDMYGAGVYAESEWAYEMAPVWRTVGRHVRFLPYVDERADEYVRMTLGAGEQEEVPKVSERSPLRVACRSLITEYCSTSRSTFGETTGMGEDCLLLSFESCSPAYGSMAIAATTHGRARSNASPRSPNSSNKSTPCRPT